MYIHWFTKEDFEKENDEKTILAMALTNWANCYLQNPPHDFGEAMVIVGQKLGVVATQERLVELAKKRDFAV